MSSLARSAMVGLAGGGRLLRVEPRWLKAFAVAAAPAGHSKLGGTDLDDVMASVGRDTAQTVVCAPFVLGVAPGVIVAAFLTRIAGRSPSTRWTR